MEFDIKSLIFGDILTNFVYKLEHIMTILWNSMKIQEHRTFQDYLEEKLRTRLIT